MGLDMYLTAKSYMSRHNVKDKQQSDAIKAIVQAPFEVEGVVLRLASWRKANHIHKWFVDNVQRGVDDCQTSSVSKEELEELLGIVTTVLADHSKAEELLPRQAGFFFGDTTYDGWYFQDLEDTRTQLEKILASNIFDEYDVNYHASW